MMLRVLQWPCKFCDPTGGGYSDLCRMPEQEEAQDLWSGREGRSDAGMAMGTGSAWFCSSFYFFRLPQGFPDKHSDLVKAA